MQDAYSSINEARAEKLLSSKLLEGFVLLEECCPVCSTPLVKNSASTDATSKRTKGGNTDPIMIPSSSFDQPFRPVPGVPMCVLCDSHVVTQESEIDLLERCESLKDKGTILVAMKDTEEEKKQEEEEYKRAAIHEIINLDNHVEPNESFSFVEEKPQVAKTRGPSPESIHATSKNTDGVAADEEYSIR
jgi:Sjogren's syndrome/scleroderma autoantigen 1 (Autoantigen p27)